MKQSSIVARFLCVVDSWPGELTCGVVFSGGPWLLDFSCVWNLCSVNRNKSIYLEFAGTLVTCRVAANVCCRTKFRRSEEQRCR